MQHPSEIFEPVNGVGNAVVFIFQNISLIASPILFDFGKVSTKVINKRDDGKEAIEIDFNGLEIDKFYMVIHQNESYAVRKISEHSIAFYDVI